MSTVLAFIAFAQEHQEEESSKAAFYVAGTVLALWAVVLAYIGITQHDFPRSKDASRGVMGLSALLVVATMATAVITG
jgi:hypothetical protein